jgi:multidrug efflux pump subunit AcrB
MTALTFIIGVFPLVIAGGAGANARPASGTAVFGGMIAATVLSMIFVPIFYAAIQRFTEWIRSEKTKCGQIASVEKTLKRK